MLAYGDTEKRGKAQAQRREGEERRGEGRHHRLKAMRGTSSRTDLEHLEATLPYIYIYIYIVPSSPPLSTLTFL
jgi:hypothetical protein